MPCSPVFLQLEDLSSDGLCVGVEFWLHLALHTCLP